MTDVQQAAKIPEKVINCLMQKGESDKIVQYSASVGYRVDYTFMLQNLVRTNPQGALEFAKKLGTTIHPFCLLSPIN